MSIAEVQNLVLGSLNSEGDDPAPSLTESFHSLDMRPSEPLTLEALSDAESSLRRSDIFHAALLYQKRIAGYMTRDERAGREEVLHLLFLWADVQAKQSSRADLREYIHFMKTRIAIREFAHSGKRSIEYISSFLGADTNQFLAEMTYSKPATVKRWREQGGNPTKVSRQTLSAVAEIFYQLHEIKALSRDETLDWFQANARQDILDNAGRYWNFFPHSVVLKLEKLGLSVIGTSAWI